ncbi:MAG: AAA family ATPase [Gammaproteobacteria bacterium]|nr:AAA family ATPase [Gammaproteobacteria bacterium]
MLPVSHGVQSRHGAGTGTALSPQLAASLSEQQQRQYALVQALQDPACYAHPTRDISVIETHISIVVLTGAFAYKIKKPLNLGFLDFSTPQRRKYFCEEEVRLNSRYASDIYLGVVTFSGSPGTPYIRDKGEGFEYAVRMMQFDQGDLLSAMLERGRLDIAHIRRVASKVAEFHIHGAARCDATAPYGSQARVLSPMLENFRQIRENLPDQETARKLADLEHWTRRNGIDKAEHIEQRRNDGFVRECHGDLHLDNIAWIGGHPVLFDGIEFNPYLRFIDTMSEIAFPVMDLQRHGAPSYARVLLNDYLETTGDYDGLGLFKLYSVYRALVRAKIIAIRSRQLAEETTPSAEFRACVRLAEKHTENIAPALFITHGLSGSGKSYVADKLVRDHGFLRLRSDHTRKRLHGLTATASTGSALDEGIYSPQATEATYSRLAEDAQTCLLAGFSVVVDAAFLHLEQRAVFGRLASRVGVDFTILDVHAPDGDIQARLESRRRDSGVVSEADHEVVSAQRRRQDVLTSDELQFTRRVQNVQGEEPTLEAVFG